MLNDFECRIQETTGTTGLEAEDISIIQVNVGLTCDLACAHCHVVSSPKRTEQMTWETMEQVLDAARRARLRAVDITGGAPELNPDFRRFVAALRAEGFEVMVRTNLTVFHEPGMADIPEFFRDHQVHVIASLPCYIEENVNAQRGDGVYARSIASLRRLNELGYGKDDRLILDLVYNPIGPALPPDEAQLEVDYKRELEQRHGIVFTRLIAIANMPIGRFWGQLKRQNQHACYADLLRRSYNPHTVDGLMCRHQVSVRWDGTVFDCDFNLALKLSVDHGAPTHIKDFDPDAFARRRIVTGDRCFGCTAGCGSSCGGALATPSEAATGLRPES